MEWERIYEGIKKGFKMLGEVGLVAGTAAVIIALVAIVIGIILDTVTTGTLPIPSAINDSVTALVGAYTDVVDYLVSGFGIAGSLIVLAVVIVVFAFVFAKSKKTKQKSYGGLGGEYQ
jgi:beta-lactamase regulating signal transducer with metallopeptidase domain